MPLIARRRRLLLAAALVGFVTACAGGKPRVGGAAGAAGTDAAADGPGSLAIDIAITGCPTLDVDEGTPKCSGAAPLTLALSPVGSLGLTRFLWTFGDGSTSSDRAPTHTFVLPGSYDVTVTGGGDLGTVSRERDGLVVVDQLAAGAPCDVTGQCAAGLSCLCTPGAGCAAAFTRGICSTPCATGFCGTGAVCAAIDPGPAYVDGGLPVDGAPRAPAGPLCLASCAADTDCPAGFSCANVRAGGTETTAWTRGCWPAGAAADLGGSCRDTTGALNDGDCTTGLCADVGALGVCSAPCAVATDCPSAAACARLPDGRRLCLTACAAVGAACGADPLLACVAAAPGDGGLSIQSAGAAAAVCASKPCSTDGDCAPSGRCAPGGQCAADESKTASGAGVPAPPPEE